MWSILRKREKVYINGPGHMTKMAAMAINSKNLLQKAYDFETWHEALGNGALQSLYKSWPWDDLDLFYSKVNLGCPCIWMGKIKKCHLMAKNLLGMSKWTEDLCLWKYFGPRGLSAPAPGLFTCVWPFYIQTSSSLKSLGQSKPNFIWNILRKSEWKFV